MQEPLPAPADADAPDRAFLSQLLSVRNQDPGRAPEIDALIHKTFGRNVAILALDMCGFSELTDRYGIVHFLAMIQQMIDAAGPAIQGNGGSVIKQDADNLFAVFANPTQALEAALDIFRAFEAMNAVLPNERDIYGSIGIGYGEALVVDGEDLFGAEVNLASKLGEDIAGRMEIIVSPTAHAALPPDRYAFTPHTYTIAGVAVECYAFEKCLFAR